MREKVLFSGFKPGQQLLSEAKSWIWSIEEQAPSNSAQRAKITKTPLGFEGSLKVSSLVGKFEVFANATSAGDILSKLGNKMGTKLNLWKSRREE